jgi:hypothetical protein
VSGFADDMEFRLTPFFDWVELPPKLPGGNLETLSGCREDLEVGTITPLIEEVTVAWGTPLPELTCEQVLVLTQQQFGLEWLGGPVCAFVRIHPQAQIYFYPGDLTMAALRAHAELAAHAPADARRMLEADFSWMEEGFAFSPDLPEEARSLLASARALSSAARTLSHSRRRRGGGKRLKR